MLLYGVEREIQQGEDWNLDIVLSQSDLEYIPFIVSSQRVNPMFAITVASTKYEKNERYVDTWWCDINNGDNQLPRFFQTVVFDLPEIPIGFPPTLPVGHSLMDCLYRFTRQEDPIDPKTGHKPYTFVYFNKSGEAKYDYSCNIRMSFASAITSNWGSQNYMYQITLVDTIPMAEVVQQAKESYPNLDWKEWVSQDDPNWVRPIQGLGELNDEYDLRVEASWVIFRNEWIMANIRELFIFIKNRLPAWFQPDIDIDSPVGRIGVPKVILPPTKLQVNNNLRRII